MNILYITTVFPRPEDGDTIYTDLACALLKSGHKLTAVVADGKNTPKKTVINHERGLDVLRVRTGNLYNVGLIKKGIATLLLGHHLKRAVARLAKTKTFDLVLYESPPLSVSRAAAYAKRKFRAASFLMLKDIFPQNGVDLGLYRKGGLIYRYFKKQEQSLYRISDKIGCMSAANMEYIKEHNPAYAEKVVYFPNTKAVSEQPERSRASVREQFRLPPDKTIFVFGGNIGIPQSPEAIAACAEKICRMEQAFFLAVGRGTHTEFVRRALSGFNNFMVLDGLPRKTYEDLLSACDVGLIFLDSRFTVPNFPSRILSYMNFSLPVLAATDTASDINQLIAESDCGLWCPAGDTAQFASCAARLCADSEMRSQLGKNGFSYFTGHFSVGNSVKLLETYMEHRNR